MSERDDQPSEIPYEQRALPNLEGVYPRFLRDHGAPQLLDCFVLSLDLLGTKAETGEGAAEQLQLTERALAHARRESGTEPKAQGSVVRWFSDNVAIADIHDGAYDSLTFGFHLMTAAALQAELAVQGRFSRGGIALGEFFASEALLYGPALVEAYTLEDQVAIYPRVILSQAAAQFAFDQLDRFQGGAEEVHRTHLAVDGDGTVFVNYLEALWETAPAEARPSLVRHRDVICERLDDSKLSPGVRQKYQWAANYHDRYCRSRYWASDLGTGRHQERTDDLVPFGAQIPIPEPPEARGTGLEF